MDIKWSGGLFRFINPTYSKAADIVDGAGALHSAGRWNLKSIIRLSYASFSPQTALSEALAHVNYYALPIAKALPRVLVALRLKAHRALDLRDGELRKALRLSEHTIRTSDWRAENQKGREAITQAWGYTFASAGFGAILVPSAADANGSNALIYPKNLHTDSHFEVESEVKWPGR